MCGTDSLPKHQGLGMSSRVCVTGHIKDPVPLIKKSRALCPSGGFPPSLIHQLIIITGLNKLYDCQTVCSCPEYGLRCRQGVKPPLNSNSLVADGLSEAAGEP